MTSPTPRASFLLIATLALPVLAQAEEKTIRLGMIGLDTSHVIAFVSYLNDPKNNTGCKVVAGFPGGSKDLESSASRVEGYTKQLREQYGLTIVASIEELCQQVDGILLESLDGRPHLQQVKPVFAAKKPVFIDKPMAASLSDVITIFHLARQAGVPCWSSSSWRYSPDVVACRKGKVGEVLGCLAYGPCHLEPHHPDLYWYGVHTAETLFALMGPGCVTVQRTSSGNTDVIVGQWKDGRIGVFRGTREGDQNGGYVVFGSKGIYQGGHAHYEGLLQEIVQFFKTGQPPLKPEQTIEIFAFMSAADESKAKGGATIKLESIMARARDKTKPKP